MSDKAKRTTSPDTVLNTIFDVTSMGAYRYSTLVVFTLLEFMLTIFDLFGGFVRIVWYVNNTDKVHLAFRLDPVYLFISFILCAVVFCDWFIKCFGSHKITRPMNDLYYRFLCWNVIIILAFVGLGICNLFASFLHKWFVGGLTG